MRTSNAIRRAVCMTAALVCAAGACFAADVAAPAKEAAPAQIVTTPQIETFDPATYKGLTGKLALPYDGQAVMLLLKVVDGKSAGYLQPYSKNGVHIVPTGKYMMAGCNVAIKGKNSGQWSVMPSIVGSAFEVKAGATTKVGTAGKLVAAIKAGKTGTIKLPFAGISSALMLTSVENHKLGDGLNANGSSESAVVPCGTYKLAVYSVVTKDDAGKIWMISVSSAPDKTRTITVKPGSQIKLQKPKPFVASIDARQNGDQMSLNLRLANADGETCSIRGLGQDAGGSGFQILSKSGEVLMSGKFQYG